MAYRPADIAVRYDERDAILYALGIGLGMDPLDRGALKFVYERAGLQAFPTMAVVLGWPGRLTDPAFGVDERLVVAGDLEVVLHRPLPPRPSSSAVRASGKSSTRAPATPRSSSIPATSSRRMERSRRHRGQQHLCAQARRLRGRSDRDGDAGCGAADAAGRDAASCRRRPISRSSIGSPATKIRCMPTPNAPRLPASIARFCTARRASAWLLTRSCARLQTTGRNASPASKRGSHARSFPARPSAPKCGPSASALVPMPRQRSRRDRAQQWARGAEVLTACPRRFLGQHDAVRG